LRSELQNARVITKVMPRNEPHASIDRESARAILGKNLFGPEEWLKYYGIWFSEQQLKEISEFPWNESVLNAPCPFVKEKRIKETHFAFLGLYEIYNEPLNVLKWHELNPFTGKQELKAHPWYEDQDFARVKTCWFKWYLTLIESVPGSTEKTHQEQLEMLPVEYRGPLVVEELTKNILYYKINKAYPNFNTWIRCRDVVDVGMNNCRICVGDFIRIRGWAGDRKHSSIGISAFRKTPYSRCRVIEP